VRHALVYVIQNRSKHGALSGLDPLSSAEWFNGFAHSLPRNFRSATPRANSPPRTWLLVTGWRRHGLIGFWEVPRR
jgi:hypothetical protein